MLKQPMILIHPTYPLTHRSQWITFLQPSLLYPAYCGKVVLHNNEIVHNYVAASNNVHDYHLHQILYNRAGVALPQTLPLAHAYNQLTAKNRGEGEGEPGTFYHMNEVIG